MLTEKCGKPSDVVEQCDGCSQPNEDDTKMYEVQFHHCKYCSIWDTDKGEFSYPLTTTT